MGHQIIREPGDGPNGEPRYCVFSGAVDNVVSCNGTREEVIEFYAEEAAERARERAAREIARIESGAPPRQPFGLDYVSMLEIIRINHGRAEVREVRRLIEEAV